jgi:hypothetical protein
MMDTVVKVGAVARVDPDPSAELAAWHQDVEVGRIDEPAVTRERLDAQARGEQIIVTLGLFAEVLAHGAVTRYDGVHITGAWFDRGAHDANLAHAREMVSGSLDAFHRDLTEGHGLEVTYQDLAEMPIAIEIDAELEQRLASAI